MNLSIKIQQNTKKTSFEQSQNEVSSAVTAAASNLLQFLFLRLFWPPSKHLKAATEAAAEPTSQAAASTSLLISHAVRLSVNLNLFYFRFRLKYFNVLFLTMFAVCDSM